MDLLDRTIFICLGIGVGLILTYITFLLRGVHKRQDTMIQTLKKHMKKEEDGILERGWAMAIALACTLSLLFYSVYMGYQNDKDNDANTAAIAARAHDNFVNVCKSGENIRNVQRALVEAIFLLATTGIQEPKTRKQQIRLNAYIDRINAFRDHMYDLIHPSKVCEPYVSDDHLEPTTPDIQHVKRRS